MSVNEPTNLPLLEKYQYLPSRSSAMTSGAGELGRMKFFSSSDLSLCEPKELEIDIDRLSCSSLLRRCEPTQTSLDSFAPEVPPPEFGDQFEKLVNWLTVYFNENRCSSCEELSLLDVKICLTILRRKFRIKDVTFAEDFESLVEELHKIHASQSAKASKRTEEKNKFIFKHTIKLLKSKIMLDKRNLSVQEAGAELLSRYGLAGNTFNNGSMSISRLREVFKNKPFAEEFLALLRDPSIEQSVFLQLYQSSIRKKLIKTLKKWGRVSEGRSCEDVTTKSMVEYFLENNQCKLPWTRQEVHSAITCFINTVGV